MLLCSVDYEGMELCTWSQVCIWATGKSRMANVINAGGDCHTELGARIHGVEKPEAYRLRKLKDHDFGEARQVAKIGNFGYQGGMGPKTLRTQARTEYRVNMSLEKATLLRDQWRQEWEPEEYFAWVNSQLHGPRDNKKGIAKHFLVDRYRGDIPYTVFCNTLFQGLASDAAKAAGCQLAYECYVDTSSPLYGCRIVNFIHDEFWLEVPDHPVRAHLAAYRHRDVMVEVAQRFVPDVKIRAQPALMLRASKNAATKHDKNGLLVAWDA